MTALLIRYGSPDQNGSKGQVDPGLSNRFGLRQAVEPVCLRRILHHQQASIFESERNSLFRLLVRESARQRDLSAEFQLHRHLGDLTDWVLVSDDTARKYRAPGKL